MRTSSTLSAVDGEDPREAQFISGGPGPWDWFVLRVGLRSLGDAVAVTTIRSHGRLTVFLAGGWVRLPLLLICGWVVMFALAVVTLAMVAATLRPPSIDFAMPAEDTEHYWQVIDDWRDGGIAGPGGVAYSK